MRAQKHTRRNGSLESVGRLVGGTRVGTWTFYHYDGKTVKARGSYDQDGLFTGRWQWFAANGKVRQDGPFLKGEQHGKWTRWFGGTAQPCDMGRYAMGKRVGTWTFYDKEGKVRRKQAFGAKQKIVSARS